VAEHAAAVAEAVPVPETRLRANAIGVAQDTVIGLASSAPAASIGLTIAAIAAATAYGSGPIILVAAVPMLVIANAYRRLNMWNANCGASFEWVGRSINPYLGFLTGWLMVAGYVLGTISGVEILAPNVLAVFGANPNNKASNVMIAIALGVIMVALAVIGIRITARTQVGMALVEYVLLIGFAVAGLVFVLGHHSGTYPITKGWFSLTGVGGRGGISVGFLAAVFMFTGWDGAVYVNEETRRRRTNPGRAAVLAVIILAVLYTFSTFGLQGVVSPSKLQANYSSAMVYIAQALGGSGWAKVMALCVALSAIATIGAGILVTARIVYGMASYRALPAPLANVSSRFSTPVPATVTVGVLVIGITCVYLLATGVDNAFSYVVDGTSILFALFYILTAVATMVYYRRRVIATVWDFITLGLLPLAAAVFLGWMTEKSMVSNASSGYTPENWSIVGVIGAGLALMLIARYVLKSRFFKIKLESDRGVAASGERSAGR
jgi:amino acid transporter